MYEFVCHVVFISPAYGLTLDAYFPFCCDLLLKQRIPSCSYPFYMLKMLLELTPSKTAAHLPLFSMNWSPPGAARLVPFLYKKQSVGTVSLWHLKIENLLLLAEVTTGRCHFKNKMLGNEGPQKRLVASAWVCESMFVLADVSQKQVHFYSLHRLDLPLRCQTMLTHIWLIIGFVPKLCMPSSASTHPFAFFLLDIVRFLFTLISAGISSLLLGATEKNKLRSLCDAKFCNVKRIKKIAFFGMCSLAFLNICMCSSGFYYEIWTRRIRNLLGLFSP